MSLLARVSALLERRGMEHAVIGRRLASGRNAADGSERIYAVARRTDSLMRWMWPRPSAFTSQPSSK